jgi:Ca-activated chloride channel family protein
MNFSLRTDVAVLPAGVPAARYVLLSLTAPEASGEAGRLPIHVAFVLDRSGSMGGSKIRLAREAVRQALGMLRRDDRFALVVYDEAVNVVVDSTPAAAEARRNALKRLEEVDARGSTDLAGGWQAGCEQVAPHLAEEPPGRCLLLTDGLANVGVTDAEELAARAAALRPRHIVTSTFGVGADFDEDLLQRLAEQSGGHFYFIEQPAQIPDLLTSELGEALEVVARGASVAVQVAAGVKAEPLTRLEWCPTDGGIRVGLGDLVSGQELEVVLRVDLPAGPAGAAFRVRMTLSDRDSVLASPPREACWSAVDQAAADAAPRDRAVDRAVAAVFAARARHEAVALNRAGQFAAARARLEVTAARIQGYAGHDGELLALVQRLLDEAARFGKDMSPMSRKAAHFASYSVMASRAVDGKARRRKTP